MHEKGLEGITPAALSPEPEWFPAIKSLADACGSDTSCLDALPRVCDLRKCSLRRRGTDGSQTLRWRKMDSNFQYTSTVRLCVFDQSATDRENRKYGG